MDNSRDINLIQEYLSGDERALEILIKQYLSTIYSFVYRYAGSDDASDITQDVFLKAWRNIRKFDQTKNFRTWLFAIAKNTALDHVKKRKAVPMSVFDDEEGNNEVLDTLADDSALPDEIFDRRNLGADVERALAGLSHPNRMLLYLRYNDHFTFEEIAGTLGESVNTVKSRHRRAIAALKARLISPDAPKS